MGARQPPSTPRPLVRWGAARTAGMWKVVLAVWALPLLVFLPVVMVAQSALGPSLAQLPERQDLPPGDLALVVVDVLYQAAPVLVMATAGGWLLLWLWSLVWHGGVARWQHWKAGEPLRLAEVFGLGFLSLWRSICLSLTALLGLGLVLVPLWVLVWTWVGRLHRAMDDGPIFSILLSAGVVTALAVLLCWAATLRGFWLLADPAGCPPVVAWVRGLWASLRQPVATFGTLLLWLVPALVLAAAPLLVGWWFEAARGGVVGGLVSVTAGIGRAYCWVALFLSFAPTTGRWPAEETGRSVTRGQRLSAVSSQLSAPPPARNAAPERGSGDRATTKERDHSDPDMHERSRG